METEWLKEAVLDGLKARDDKKQSLVSRLTDEQLSIFDKIVEEVRARKGEPKEPEPKRMRTDNENLTSSSSGLSDAAVSFLFKRHLTSGCCAGRRRPSLMEDGFWRRVGKSVSNATHKRSM